MALYESAKIERAGEKMYSASTDETYWNAVGPFGGWIAAVLLRCVDLETGGSGDPLSFSVNFAGPMQQGTFGIRLREVRANRSTTFWSAEIVQTQAEAEAVCAFATIVFAKRRATPAFLDAVAPKVEPPETFQNYSLGSVRPFLRRFDLRFVGGGAFPTLIDGQILTWARSLDATAMDYETLTAICDVGLPHIFLRLRKPVPVSSVTMNVFYHAARSEVAKAGDDFLLTASRMRSAGDGFFDASTNVWTRAGVLLATTEQIVWFKVPE